MIKRIFLSPPHMGGQELEFVHEAFASNYIAPVGPQVEAFEREFAEIVGAKYAAAVSSGTAALHLALRYVGVGEGDEVVCSSFTFVATANAIVYQGAVPVFIDSDETSWNMDPGLLAKFLEKRSREGSLPKAVVLVHLYGQPADIDAIVVTTSGGGMLISDEEALVKKVRFWATQARDAAVHYEHSEVGYNNFRMSNVLAGIRRGQLRVLKERVEGKRRIFAAYVQALGDLPGLAFMPEPDFCRSTRWLTCLTVDPALAGTDRDAIIKVLDADSIESRPTWKPMHLQPLYAKNEMLGGEVSERLFAQGICLPSGTAMTDEDMARVIGHIRSCWQL